MEEDSTKPSESESDAEQAQENEHGCTPDTVGVSKIFLTFMFRPQSVKFFGSCSHERIQLIRETFSPTKLPSWIRDEIFSWVSSAAACVLGTEKKMNSFLVSFRITKDLEGTVPIQETRGEFENLASGGSPLPHTHNLLSPSVHPSCIKIGGGSHIMWPAPAPPRDASSLQSRALSQLRWNRSGQ